MTTSKTLYNHLKALSQQAKRKDPVKVRHASRKNVQRFVEMTKVVLHSATGIGHHLVTRKPTVVVTPSLDTDEATVRNTKSKTKDKKSSSQPSSAEGDNATITNSEETSSSSSPAAATGDDYYLNLSAQLEKDIEEIERRRIQAKQKQVDFWNLYKFSLEKVSNLNDLRDAPDAILPGNHITPSPIVEEKSKQSEKEEVTARI